MQPDVLLILRPLAWLLIALMSAWPHAAAQLPPQSLVPQRAPLVVPSDPAQGADRLQRLVTVPSIIGATRAEAERRLTAARLALQPGRAVPPGPDARVVRQTPEAGRSVPPSTRVTAVFAVEQAQLVPVPSIIGLDVVEARRRLSEAQLVLQFSQTRTPESGATVTQQNPRPGQRVPVRTRVVATFETRGPQLVPVPSIIGADAREAQRRVADVRLVLQPDPPSPIAAGATVARQDPPAGARVTPGTRIIAAFTVPLQLVPVPSIIGDSPTEADQHLTAVQLALQPEQRAPLNPDGRVVRQSPQPGERVQRGSTVVATFEVPPPQLITVPSIIGVNPGEAERRLASAHLALRSDQRMPSGHEAKVVRQIPDAGQQVPRDTAVTAIFEVPPAPMVSVPAIVGVDATEAQRRLTTVNLTMRLESGTPSAPGATIVRQSPAPGRQVAQGTQVTIAFAAPTTSWAVASWLGGVLALVVAAGLVGIWRWVARLRRPRRDIARSAVLHVHARNDPGRPSISSNNDPAGPSFGIRLTQSPPMIVLTEHDGD